MWQVLLGSCFVPESRQGFFWFYPARRKTTEGNQDSPDSFLPDLIASCRRS
jgi:hypothetical protein